MNNQMKYGLAGLLIGGIVVWAFMTTTGVSTRGGMMGSQYNNTQNTKNSDILDAHFIEQMIPHHEDAITMAKLAQTRAKKPEVKQLAEDIVIAQTKEIDQMRAWLKKW